MKKSYKTFDEWKLDLERINKSPSDKHLLAHVVKCIENSSDKIKKEIKEYLSNSALETNPWTIFDQISKECPNHVLFVKTREDPWFSS